jgi:hypothetical protein
MSKLVELQDCFQGFLLHSNKKIESLIHDSKSVPTETRLAIYHHAYRYRLLEALASNYPMLSAYMSESEFEQLGNEYIDCHPSSTPSIRWFGDKLMTFLSQSSRYQPYPYLAELAHVEWVMTLTFDAKDETAMTIDDMATISPHAWPSMHFVTHPSLHQLSLSWNVMAIWQAIMDDLAPPQPVQGLAIAWIFWRHELSTQFCSLAEPEQWGIQALLNHASFGDICAGLCTWVKEEEAPMHAASLLKKWLSAGLITKVITSEP